MLIINPQSSIPIQITPGSGSRESQVAIYGAVKTPGIYRFSGDLRIGDIVEMAGGLEENADEIHANLPGWTNDGETIIIPTKGVFQPTLTLPVSENEKININSADKAELMKLEGIGEKRAGDIIELRNEMGGFNSPEDILKIPGISEKLLDNIYDRIIVQ